jgi:L-seryl-tRNA(Ser) seleniumtransferase
MAHGRHVLVSRGELVEIGGGFRIPEIMESSGAILREVGSTNRTRLEDYRGAMSEGDTALILKVHRSNFRITGFTEEATLPDLAELGKEEGIGVVHDLGSGLLVDSALLGLPPEPRPTESLAAGVDVVAFSGDKLLGGPQAGILVGKREWIERMRRNPLCRALRVDKVALAGLEATLSLYRDPEVALREVPTLRMLSASIEELEARAGDLLAKLEAGGVGVSMAPGASVVGGGTFPGVELPTRVLRIPGTEGRAPDQLAAALRDGNPPVICRIEGNELVLDPRTIEPDEVADLVARLTEVWGSR